MGVIPVNWCWSTCCLWLFWCCSTDGHFIGWTYHRNLLRSLDMDEMGRQSDYGWFYCNVNGNGFGNYQFIPFKFLLSYPITGQLEFPDWYFRSSEFFILFYFIRFASVNTYINLYSCFGNKIGFNICVWYVEHGTPTEHYNVLYIAWWKNLWHA